MSQRGPATPGPCRMEFVPPKGWRCGPASRTGYTPFRLRVTNTRPGRRLAAVLAKPAAIWPVRSPGERLRELLTVTYPYDAASSAALFNRAQRVTPGGVNSPVRAFRAVGGTPRFMVRGEGPYLWDADGTRYVDLVSSWGPMILGHAHPAVVDAVRAAATSGLSFGTPTEGEVELAEEIVGRVVPVEAVRLVNSGT